MKCSQCKVKYAEWDFKEDQFCQECFETWCNAEFWRAVDEGRII